MRRRARAGRSRGGSSRTRGAGRRPGRPFVVRRRGRPVSASSAPRSRADPLHGSRNRSRTAATVLLPVPDAPTSATRSPGARSRVTGEVAGARRSQRARRSVSSTLLPSGRARPGTSATAGGVRSSISSRSSAAVRAAGMPASAQGRATSIRARGSSTSRAITGPLRLSDATGARGQARGHGHGGPACGQDHGPCQRQPAGGRDRDGTEPSPVRRPWAPARGVGPQARAPEGVPARPGGAGSAMTRSASPSSARPSDRSALLHEDLAQRSPGRPRQAAAADRLPAHPQQQVRLGDVGEDRAGDLVADALDLDRLAHRDQ